MSVYFLAPPPSIATGEHSFVTWENGFSEEELNEIDRIGSSLIVSESSIQNSVIDTSIRKSKNSWIGLSNESQFLYDKIGWISRQLNGQFFDFDITGFFEDFQYTIYDSDSSHYDWHLDRGSAKSAPRKLSVVLQLSDPSEYEGGDLEFYIGQTPTKLEKRKGLVVAFPSFVLHRVTPVTKGVRKSLVVWLSGPKFK